MKLCTACIFTGNSSAPAAQRRSQVKWLSRVKPEKNACPASALFQCSLIRSDADDAAAAAGRKTTQRRRRPRVCRRTALVGYRHPLPPLPNFFQQLNYDGVYAQVYTCLRQKTLCTLRLFRRQQQRLALVCVLCDDRRPPAQDYSWRLFMRDDRAAYETLRQRPSSVDRYTLGVVCAQNTSQYRSKYKLDLPRSCILN